MSWTHGIELVADEVVTGVGEPKFWEMPLGLSPNNLTMGKGIKQLLSMSAIAIGNTMSTRKRFR